MASSTGRCYLLELPPELRVMIYDFYFDYHRKLPNRPLGPGEAERVAAKNLIKDCVSLKKHHELLYTCPQIMTEAIPSYQKALQDKIRLLKRANDDYEDYIPEMFFVRNTFKIIVNLRRLIKKMERRLAEWEDADRKVSETIRVHTCVSKIIRQEV